MNIRTERRGLGRGLVSCSSERSRNRFRLPQTAHLSRRRWHRFRWVPTSPSCLWKRSPNPRQPRTVFDEEAMNELVESIREVGMLQPIVVRPLRREVRARHGRASVASCATGGVETIPRSYAKQQITNCSATPSWRTCIALS